MMIFSLLCAKVTLVDPHRLNASHAQSIIFHLLSLLLVAWLYGHHLLFRPSQLICCIVK